VDVLFIAVGQYLACGLLNLTLGLVIERGVIPSMAEHWWIIVYTGIISVGLGYTLQAAGQRYAPPADAAIILSLEAVFAALFGWLFLEELLSPVQLLGCGIMLAGMLLSQAHLFRRPAADSGG
jgi:drug/metabolite transporter (DMT)-like permease